MKTPRKVQGQTLHLSISASRRDPGRRILTDLCIYLKRITAFTFICKVSCLAISPFRGNIRSRFLSSPHCATSPSTVLLSVFLQHRSSRCYDLPVCLSLFHSAAFTNPVCHRALFGLIKSRRPQHNNEFQSAQGCMYASATKKKNEEKKNSTPARSCQLNVWSSLVDIHAVHTRGPKIESHIL